MLLLYRFYNDFIMILLCGFVDFYRDILFPKIHINTFVDRIVFIKTFKHKHEHARDVHHKIQTLLC